MTLNANADNLTEVVMGIFEEYKNEVDEVTAEVIDEVSKECVNDLKQASPVKKGRSGGKYKRGWKRTYTKNVLGEKIVAIHNTQYQLTHLLEYGHDLVSKDGTVYGRARAIPHIEPVEQKTIAKYEEELARKLNAIK